MLFNRSNMRDNDQSYLSSASESLRFNYYRAKGHLFRYLGNRIKWHVYPRLHVLPSFPDHVEIETCSACNMRCPMCFTITKEFKENVNLTIMKFDFSIDRVNTMCIDERTSSYNTVYIIPFRQQKLGKIRTILSSYTSY